MDTYSIIITRQAKEQLANIRDYILYELKSLENARQTINRLFGEIKKLNYMPHRIKVIEEMPWKEYGIRKIRVKNYYIYYWINESEKTVFVVSVIYVKRNQVKQLQEMKIQ